jgi:hypothetical protein
MKNESQIDIIRYNYELFDRYISDLDELALDIILEEDNDVVAIRKTNEIYINQDAIKSVNLYRSNRDLKKLLQENPGLKPQACDLKKLWDKYDTLSTEELAEYIISIINEVI